MQVVAEEQAASAAAAGRHKQAQKRQQVQQVLLASRLRAERATRVARLKVPPAPSAGRRRRCFCWFWPVAVL